MSRSFLNLPNISRATVLLLLASLNGPLGHAGPNEPSAETLSSQDIAKIVAAAGNVGKSEQILVSPSAKDAVGTVPRICVTAAGVFPCNTPEAVASATRAAEAPPVQTESETPEADDESTTAPAPSINPLVTAAAADNKVSVRTVEAPVLDTTVVTTKVVVGNSSISPEVVSLSEARLASASDRLQAERAAAIDIYLKSPASPNQRKKDLAKAIQAAWKRFNQECHRVQDDLRKARDKQAKADQAAKRDLERQAKERQRQEKAALDAANRAERERVRLSVRTSQVPVGGAVTVTGALPGTGQGSDHGSRNGNAGHGTNRRSTYVARLGASHDPCEITVRSSAVGSAGASAAPIAPPVCTITSTGTGSGSGSGASAGAGIAPCPAQYTLIDNQCVADETGTVAEDKSNAQAEAAANTGGAPQAEVNAAVDERLAQATACRETLSLPTGNGHSTSQTSTVTVQSGAASPCAFQSQLDIYRDRDGRWHNADGSLITDFNQGKRGKGPGFFSRSGRSVANFGVEVGTYGEIGVRRSGNVFAKIGRGVGKGTVAVLKGTREVVTAPITATLWVGKKLGIGKLGKLIGKGLGKLFVTNRMKRVVGKGYDPCSPSEREFVESALNDAHANASVTVSRRGTDVVYGPCVSEVTGRKSDRFVSANRSSATITVGGCGGNVAPDSPCAAAAAGAR